MSRTLRPGTPLVPALWLLLVLLAPGGASAQQTAPFNRLPVAQFDVTPPSGRVSGSPGTIAVRQTTCRSVPISSVRRRIVDVAVQEWAFFGFPVVDQRAGDDDDDDNAPGGQPPPRRPRRVRDPVEAMRVAPSIAGYWTATPEGAWVVGRQNQAWNGPDGLAARWQFPWSAAFISWVMCEGGLGATTQFQRAAAHHAYIDQAIRARDSQAASGLFVAYDKGEALVEPGDLLCSARRPAYRTLAQRRSQMGEGARTHCDVVVTADAAAGRVLAIGGNVRGVVGLKILPAVSDRSGVRSATGFAHLKLRVPSIDADAFRGSPTMQAIACAPGAQLPSLLLSAGVREASNSTC